MSDFVLPAADGRMYLFHIKVHSFEGLELYTRGERGMKLNQAFYSPEFMQRVDCCMITARNLGISEVYTVTDLSNLSFTYPAQRTQLEEVEVIEFAKRGLKVITLDKIS